MTLVRNETQQHSAALKSAGQNPISLLPLYSADGLRRQVVADAADAGNFCSNASGDALQQRPVKLWHLSGHDVNGVDAADDAGPVVCALALANTGCTEVGHYGEVLSDGESRFVDFLAHDSVSIAQGFQAVAGDGAKAANAQVGAGEGLALNHVFRQAQLAANNAQEHAWRKRSSCLCPYGGRGVSSLLGIVGNGVGIRNSFNFYSAALIASWKPCPRAGRVA